MTRTTNIALALAAIATAPAMAFISPISQARSVTASYSFESPGGSSSDLQTISASDFGAFAAEIAFDDVRAAQNSGINPGGHAGIYGTGFVSTVGAHDDLGSYSSNATSSFELVFTLDTPMSLSGVIGATYNGGGDGIAELDVFVSLARQGGATETWRVMTSTGESFAEGFAFNAELTPGAYTLTAFAHNNNLPFNAFSEYPALSTGTFAFQIGVPAPASVLVLAIGAMRRRRVV